MGVLCSRDEEDVHHLFIHCLFSSNVCHDISKPFGVVWVMPGSVKDLFDHWNYGFRSYRGKVIWKLMLVAVLWNIWLERNNRIFQGQCRRVNMVVDIILSQVSIWASNCKEFERYSSADNLRFREALFKGGCKWSNHISLWATPPQGVLKLNFDGDYIRVVQRQGVVGVI